MRKQLAALRAKVTRPEGLRSAVVVPLSEGGILHAAVEVFVQHGFAATRVEDILAAAGVARRTFYKYFRSKEDVLAAIYDLATRELLSAIQSAAAGESESPLEALWLGLDVYLDYHLQHAKLVRILVQQAIRSDSPLAPFRLRFRDDLVRLLDAAVRANTGEVHDPMFYTALISAVEGVSLDLVSSRAGVREIARAKAVLRLLIERTLRISRKA